MKKILNLTQHNSTVEQKEAGIIDMSEELRTKIVPLLNFYKLPSEEDIEYRVVSIQKELYANYGLDYNNPEHTDDIFKKKSKLDGFMIGGALFLMTPLADAISYMGNVYYAFTKRVSIEETQDDGTVIKKSVFKFEGLVPHI